MPTLIWLVIVLVITGLMIVLLNYLPLPAPFNWIVRALVILIAILVLYERLGGTLR